MFVQDQKQFVAALENDTTSPSFVLVVVIDETTNRPRTACIPANLLIGALTLEKGLAPSAEAEAGARKAAMASSTHVFKFVKPKAFANLGLDNEVRAGTEACRIIRSGHPAFMADRTGQIQQGQP